MSTIEPFGYFRALPFGWEECAETDEGAVAIYDKAALDAAVREEREACARLCDEEEARALRNWNCDIPQNKEYWCGGQIFSQQLAEKIRARNEDQEQRGVMASEAITKLLADLEEAESALIESRANDRESMRLLAEAQAREAELRQTIVDLCKFGPSLSADDFELIAMSARANQKKETK